MLYEKLVFTLTKNCRLGVRYKNKIFSSFANLVSTKRGCVYTASWRWGDILLAV